ncbi:gp53-like domain-containing protein [Citrobacter freundii]|uniref:gp53-like domain-containing protein n=1 Tax=Citrobacter freundii TaxID=546 RepID=UPI003F8D76DB
MQKGIKYIIHTTHFGGFFIAKNPGGKMALSLLAANNAQTVLAAGISSTATSLTVNAGTGTLFPSPVAGTSFFKLTIIDAATGTLTEIVHVTARNGDVFTIQRGQEGTVARAWSANDIAANMMTAGTLSYILGNFQPLDPTLTALAALVGAANKLPYFDGDDTAALTDLTQVGRDIIGKSSIADILTYLGLGKTDSPEFGGLTTPNVTLRPGKISFLSSEDGKIIAITVNGESVAEIKSEHIFHKRALIAGEFLQAPKLIFRDGDINFYSGPGNLVMQVGGNDVATLTPENLYHVKQVAAAESLKAPKVILRDGDVNLVGGENNLVIQVGGSDIASLTPGNNFLKGKVTAETSLQVGSTCILAADGNLTGSKWGGWLDAFMKDAMSTDGNGLWWDAFSSQLQFRIGDFNIADATGGAGTSVTFPKAFKNGCLMVIPVPGNGGAAQQIGTQSYSASGAVIQKGASDNNPRSGKYLAVGY